MQLERHGWDIHAYKSDGTGLLPGAFRRGPEELREPRSQGGLIDLSQRQASCSTWTARWWTSAAGRRSWRTWAAEYPVDPAAARWSRRAARRATSAALGWTCPRTEGGGRGPRQLELEYADVGDVAATPGARPAARRAGPAGSALGGGDQRRRPAGPVAGRGPDQPALLVAVEDVQAGKARPGGLPAGRRQARRRSTAVPGGGGRRGRGPGRGGGRRHGRGAQGRPADIQIADLYELALPLGQVENLTA